MHKRLPVLSCERVSRRTILAGLATLAAAPAMAAAGAGGKETWLAYEARLRARLDDAGGGVFAEGIERDLLAQTNTARGASGAAGCSWSEELAVVARAHAADLAQRGYVEHLSPEGFDPTHRVGVLARRMIGSASENIAYRRADTPATAADLMEIWRKSPPHWTNLLRASHAQVGFGVAVREEKTYTVGLYARPDGELGAPLPFKVQGEVELSRALAAASPQIDSFALADPLDEDGKHAMTERAPGRQLAPGVYQLRPRRRLDERRYEVLWGPIFVRV